MRAFIFMLLSPSFLSAQIPSGWEKEILDDTVVVFLKQGQVVGDLRAPGSQMGRPGYVPGFPEIRAHLVLPCGPLDRLPPVEVVIYNGPEAVNARGLAAVASTPRWGLADVIAWQQWRDGWRADVSKLRHELRGSHLMDAEPLWVTLQTGLPISDGRLVVRLSTSGFRELEAQCLDLHPSEGRTGATDPD